MNIDSAHVEPIVSNTENNILVDFASRDIVNERTAKNVHVTHDGLQTDPPKSFRVPKSNKSFDWFIF